LTSCSTRGPQKALHNTQEFAEFLKLFNGADQISGTGQGYTLAYNWLNETNDKTTVIKKIAACVVFNEKPQKYLLLGKTAKADMGAQIVDSRIAMYLPCHNSMPTGDTPEETAKISASRGKFPKEFQLVNFTQVRAVAYMAVEAQARMVSISITPQTQQWVQSYGGNPQIVLAKIDAIMPEENQTKKIKKQQLHYFVSNSAFWGPLVEQLVKLLSA